MKPLWFLLLTLIFSGCFHTPELPKLVEFTYADSARNLTSMICIRRTTADARHLIYDCDTGKIYGKARGRMWEYHGEEIK
mgnify:CR=1 FL=1